MSMPRKAMKEMGFQTCCLLCDADDIVGTERCRQCIATHAVVRDALPDNPTSPIDQLAVELMQMLANPHRWDHDLVHGPTLRKYQILAGEFADVTPLATSEEVADLFERQAQNTKTSVIRDIANQSQWKDIAPSPAEAREINREITPAVDSSAGVRTVPSRQIEKVDVSDRLGEDRGLSDRVAAAEKGGKAPKGHREQVEDSEFARRQAQRIAWDGEVEGVSELLRKDTSPSTDSDTIEGSESKDSSMDSVDDELDI
jgi:hypothetical protein